MVCQPLVCPVGVPQHVIQRGKENISHSEDYTSHNTTRLDVEQVKTLLLKLDFIKDELRA